MTKLSWFALVAGALGLATAGGVAAIQSPKKIVVLTNTNNNNNSKENDLLLSLRGGDLGSIKGETLAQAFSIAAGCDAVCGALVPRRSMNWFGIPIAKGSLSHKYLHGIGASAATIAVATFLAVSQKTTVEQAIAYGFVARLVSMTFMILSEGELKVGMMPSMFGAMWLVLATTVYALLTGTGDALTIAKVVSVVLGIHGFFLYLKPGVFLKKTPIAIGPDPMVEEILSINGGYMLASAIATGLLAHGVDPVKVTGYTAVGFIPVLYKFFEVIELEHMWGVSTTIVSMAAVALMACIMVGTLH